MKIIRYSDIYKNEVIHLILQIQNQEAKVNLSLEEQPDLKSIEESYFREDGFFWMAIDQDGQLAGTLGLMNKGDGNAVLKKFFVRKDARSQKAGLQFYQTLEEYAAGHQIHRILLDTPSAAKAAQRFYEKNGFIRIDKDECPFPYIYPDIYPDRDACCI